MGWWLKDAHQTLGQSKVNINRKIGLRVKPSSFFHNLLYRAHKDYWAKLNPSTGRPFSASMSKPDNWGVTKGNEILKQMKEDTTEAELESLRIKANEENVAR